MGLYPEITFYDDNFAFSVMCMFICMFFHVCCIKFAHKSSLVCLSVPNEVLYSGIQEAVDRAVSQELGRAR